MDVVDPYTVKLNLNQYSNSLLTTIGSTFVVSQKAYIDHGANKDAETWMRANIVGTGPFKMVAATPNVSIEGTRFDDYWAGKPYLDKYTMRTIPDQASLSVNLDYLDQRIRMKDALSAFAFPSDAVPPIMTRMQSVAASAGDLDCPLVVMDTAPAAILGDADAVDLQGDAQAQAEVDDADQHPGGEEAQAALCDQPEEGDVLDHAASARGLPPRDRVASRSSTHEKEPCSGRSCERRARHASP